MKTPWRAIYDAGERIDAGMDNGQPAVMRSRFVGLFYFAAVFLGVFIVAALARWIAPNSSVNEFVQLHFDGILYFSLGAFIFYAIGLTFWQAFFPQSDDEDPADGR